jgi:hypothetical protein
MPTTITATATALATTTKVEGNVWVTRQLLAAVGQDGWWWRISLSLSADFLTADFCWLIAPAGRLFLQKKLAGTVSLGHFIAEIVKIRDS